MIPSAILTGLPNLPFSLVQSHMQTSLFPSAVPPKAATIYLPVVTSTIVEAWHCAKGGELNTNSSLTLLRVIWQVPVIAGKNNVSIVTDILKMLFMQGILID